jgi:mitochondrial fission protein ELM1
MPTHPDSVAAWVLLGRRLGDNNQAIALAEALGVAFVEKRLRFTLLRYLPRRFPTLGLWTVDSETRQALVPPWPTLVIGVGKRSGAVARAIRARSGGVTRVILLGEPRSPPGWYDLVITTPQYRVAPAPNVCLLPLALAKGIKRHILGEDTGPPTRVLLIGGPSWPWRPDGAAVIAAARHCRDEADRDGGAVLALVGRRTPPPLRDALVAILGRENVEGTDYRAAVARGTVFYVTADSASMLSDAITTGRPVAMLPVEASRFGRMWVAMWRRLRPDAPLWPRDLPRFWESLRAQGLVGTAEAPRCGPTPDVPALARASVEAMLALSPR